MEPILFNRVNDQLSVHFFAVEYRLENGQNVRLDDFCVIVRIFLPQIQLRQKAKNPYSTHLIGVQMLNNGKQLLALRYRILNHDFDALQQVANHSPRWKVPLHLCLAIPDRFKIICAEINSDEWNHVPQKFVEAARFDLDVDGLSEFEFLRHFDKAKPEQVGHNRSRVNIDNHSVICEAAKRLENILILNIRLEQVATEGVLSLFIQQIDTLAVKIDDLLS